MPVRCQAKKPSTRFTPLNVGAWNVRTLLDREASNRPDRRTALVAKEIARYGIDIVALSETRFAGQGQLSEASSGYTFFWSGKEDTERRESGVGFAIRDSLLKGMKSLPVGVNDRMMSMRLPLRGKQHLTLISVYAPTMTHTDENKEMFYRQLHDLVDATPKGDKLIILGDFNARVGSDSNTWGEVIGQHGIGRANSNGLLLLSFCLEHSLAITNTMFQLNDHHKVTWMHPRSKHWHLIDYIITRKKDLRDFHITRALRGADCWTDHCLLRSKLKLQLRKPKRPHGTKPIRRLDAAKLASMSSQYQAALADKLEKLTISSCDVEKSWIELRDVMLSAGFDTVGYRGRKSKDWFDDNDDNINELLAQRQSALSDHLSDPNNPSKRSRYLSLKADVQRQLRQMKDDWFKSKVSLLQFYADTKNMKHFYAEMKSVYGPGNHSVAPVKNLEGDLLKNVDEINKRWSEHFEKLLNKPSQIVQDAIDEVVTMEPKSELDLPPTDTEVSAAIRELQIGKAAGPDGIVPELIKYGGADLNSKLTAFFGACWDKSRLPQELKDAQIVHLYKGKGDKSVCDNHRGISLLSIAGKVLAKVLLARLNEHILDSIIPESQCGFRPNRGTADMIFAVRQLQEKCQEQNKELYILFLDLTKAFDTVSREGLWKILPRIGCPPKMVEMIKQLHDGMNAEIVGSEHSFPITNGVKQGCVLAPTLFSILFSLMLISAFKDSSSGINVRYRTDRGVFDIRSLKAKTKTTDALIRDLLYADDCAIVTHSEADLQELTNRLSAATKRYGLTISIKKTEVLHQSIRGSPTEEPCILIDGQKLNNVEHFTYLGSCVSANCSLDKEVTNRIARACASFGRLGKKIWYEKGLSQSTKIAVYGVMVLPSLLYGSETWTTYRRHIKALEQFHQRCLRKILGIRWQDRVTNVAVLERADLPSIESILMRNQLRWSGHVARMDNSRLPKQIFYSELCSGARCRGRPVLRYKDVLKERLTACGISHTAWESLAADRNSWRQATHQGVSKFETERRQGLEDKRAARKKRASDISKSAAFVCPNCSKPCASEFGLRVHSRVHRGKHN